MRINFQGKTEDPSESFNHLVSVKWRREAFTDLYEEATEEGPHRARFVLILLSVNFTTMEIVVLKMLLIGSVSAQFGKHVYVPRYYQWLSAQKHCRDHYTDLSPINTWREEKRLKNATFGKVQRFWVGLYRNVTNGRWSWSGGVPATYTRWDVDEPDSGGDQIYTSVCWNGCGWNGWHNYPLYRQLPFFCLNLILMESKKTWDQALWHCKQTQTTLTSLTSETEHLLALRMIQHDRITQRVWIGLRYLESSWLWVDTDPLVYQAWPEGGDQDHECPIWKRCGALTKGGLWENWDCQERLNFICY